MVAQFLDPKNDYAFKQIFGREKHKDILIHFLNDVLKLQGKQMVTTVKFLTPIQDPEIAAKKQSIVDVLCMDGSGRQFVVEMQVARTTGFKERALYYASKAYTNQMVKGGQYETLKEVIFIAIINYELFPNKTHYHSSHTLRDRDTHEEDLKGMRFEFLELPSFKKTLDTISSMTEKWCYFFKHASETTPQELEKLVGSDEVIQEAYHALDSAYWTENELRLYEQETKSENDGLSMLRYAELTGIEKGREEGLTEGIEKGRTAEKFTLTRNALQADLALPVIAQLTGLSIKQIEKLKKTLEKA